MKDGGASTRTAATWVESASGERERESWWRQCKLELEVEDVGISQTKRRTDAVTTGSKPDEMMMIIPQEIVIVCTYPMLQRIEEWERKVQVASHHIPSTLSQTSYFSLSLAATDWLTLGFVVIQIQIQIQG